MYTMPAGTYYLGDPCYVIGKEDWLDFIEKLNDPVSRMGGCFDFLGHTVCAIGTCYGDGSYRTSLGNELCVDAGLIGVIPMELVDEYINKGGPDNTHLGCKVVFNKEFNCRYNDGILEFGTIIVDTNFIDSEEDPDEYEEEFDLEELSEY